MMSLQLEADLFTRLTLLLCLASPISSWATIHITSVTGVSRSDTTTPSAPAYYGGVDGPSFDGGTGETQNSCITPNLNTTCTSYTATDPFCACNTAQIGEGTIITINFYSDSATSGYPAIQVTSSSAGSSSITLSGSSPSSGVSGKSQAASLSFTWQQLCTAMGSAVSGCTPTVSNNIVSVQVKIGISTVPSTATFNGPDDVLTITFGVLTQTGNDLVNDCSSSTGAVCSFWAYPGDSGVYLENTNGDAGFPGNVVALQAFIAQGTAASDDFSNSYPQLTTNAPILQINSDGSLPNKFVGGLNNDPQYPYFFRIGTLDKANNLFNLTSTANVTNASYGKCNNDGTDNSYTSTCLYRAFPDAVQGILAKDLNCFVATAAYGSSMEPKIQTFRDFRRQFLLLNPWGRKFVYTYNKYGPIAAHWISEHEWARTASRAALWPLWGFAKLSLKWGLERAILALLLLIVVLAAGFAGALSHFRKSNAR